MVTQARQPPALEPEATRVPPKPMQVPQTCGTAGTWGCDAVRCDGAGRGCGVLCLRREWVRCRVGERGVAPKRFNGQLEGALVLRGLYGDAW